MPTAQYAPVAPGGQPPSAKGKGKGLIVGLGSLAKYAMAMFPVGLALFFAFSPKERRYIRWRGPASALASAKS